MNRQLAASGTSLSKGSIPSVILRVSPHCTIVFVIIPSINSLTSGQMTTEPLLSARHDASYVLKCRSQVKGWLAPCGQGLGSVSQQ